MIEPAIRGWDRKHKPGDVSRARLGLRLLEAITERRGRPPGTTAYSEAAFKGAYATAYQAVADRSLKRPGRLRVAVELNLDLKTFNGYLARWYLTFPPTN